MTGEATLGMVFVIIALGILIFFAIVGTVWGIIFDGYGRRPTLRDYDTRRPDPPDGAPWP